MNNRIVKCPFCKKSMKESEMIEEIRRTDIIEGYDWDHARYKHEELKLCPNCKGMIIRDNEVIKWKRYKGD